MDRDETIGRIGRREMLARTLAGTAAGTAALGGVGVSSALAAEKLTFVTPFRYLIGFAPVLYAKSGGYFAKQGFDATVLGGNGSASAMQQLIAGRAKFTRTSSIDIIKAIANQKVPLLAISTIAQGSVFSVVSPADRPIKTAADFKGKKIGVVSVGGGTENLLNMMLIQAGIDPKTVGRQAVGNSPGAFGLVKQGRIDAYIISIGSVIALREMGEKIYTFNTDKYAPNPSQVYVCTKETAEKEPQTVVRFLKAVQGSVREILMGDRLNAIRSVTKEFDVIGAKNKHLTRLALDAELKLWLTQGDDNLMRNVPDLWKSAQTLTAKAGIGKIDDIQTVYTNKFMDQL